MGLLNKIFKKNDTIYILYDNNDEGIARNVCGALEYNGLSCWMKSRDSFNNNVPEIIKAIKDSGLCVVIYSENSRESRFVMNEIDVAFGESIPFLLFKTDAEPLEGANKFFLNKAQCIEAYPNYTDHYKLLVETCLKSLGKSTKNIQIPEKFKSGNFHDVFISYSQMDKDIADRICTTLEDNGIKCWIAPRDIKTGENYIDETYDGLNGASIFIPVFSKDYQKSENLKKEVELAFSNEKTILVFRVNSFPENEFEFYLKSSNWIDAEADLNAGYESIIKTTATLLGKPISTIKLDESASKQKPDLTLSAISDTVVCGKVIALSGSLKLGDEAISGANIDIYKKEDLVDTVVTSNAGNFSLLIETTDIETLEFKAILKENDLYKRCESMTVSVDVVEAEKPQNDSRKTPPPAYHGNEPYIFVSYSHKDSKAVFAEIERFQSMGYNIWYDEGITPGGEWADTILEALLNSSALIAFTSKNSAASSLIINEISLASDNDIAILNILLEETELPSSLKLKLSDKQPVEKYNMDDDEYMFRCISAFKKFGIESSRKDEIDEFLAIFNEDDDGFAFKNDETIPHVDEIPFPAYEGDDAYAFVSYSHRDYKFVFNEIDRFNRQGLNIWYDDGIAPGNEWLAEIGKALSGASLFIVFISENSVSSKYVRKEITYAISKDIPFIAIHIEKTQLPIQLDLALGDLQAILQYGMNDSEYYRRYTKAFNFHLKDYGIRLKRVDEIE